jgi:histone acetyltransferase 1
MKSAALISSEETISDTSLSSAARCIQLKLLEHESFRPEYTHQPFPGETIRGYRPMQEAAQRETAMEHDQNEEQELRSELCIRVLLSPSCRMCRVEMDVRRPRKKHALRTCVERNAKRPCSGLHHSSVGGNESVSSAVAADAGKEEHNAEPSSDEHTEESSSYSDDVSCSPTERSDDGDREGNTRRQRVPLTDIRDRLAMCLPEIVKDTDDHLVEGDYLAEPFGCVLNEYESNGFTYCLALAKGLQVADYHKEVQKIALFFIETADDVDVADESKGYWRLLYLFRKHNSKQFSLVGYMTLYHFTSHFRKPLPGTVVRICQALLLPPYQRSGHGQRMLTIIHEWADGVFNHCLPTDLAVNDIVEINVEDPAPAFIWLRNKVDYQRFINAAYNNNMWFGDYSAASKVNCDNLLEACKESVTVSAAVKAKITTRQAQIVYEIYRFHEFRNRIETSGLSEEDNELLEKRYRLVVKKTLQKLHREDMSACRNKQEMQDLISTLYENAMRTYARILGRIPVIPPPP